MSENFDLRRRYSEGAAYLSKVRDRMDKAVSITSCCLPVAGETQTGRRDRQQNGLSQI